MPLPAAINERLGPLPVYAWGMLAGGGILAGQYVYRRSRGTKPAPSALVGSSAATAPAASPSVPAQSSADGSFFAAGTYTPSGAIGAPTTAVAGLPAITDNDQWIRTATILVASTNPGLSYTQINEALKAYIDGRPVTEQQAAIIELAMRTSAGQPPYQAPAIQIVPVNNPSPVLSPPPPIAAPVPVAPPAPAPVAPVVTAPTVRGGAPGWGGSDWGWLPGYLSGVRFVKGSGPAVYDVTARGLEWVPNDAALARLSAGIPESQKRVVEIPNTALYPLPRVGALPSPDAYGDPTLGW